MQCRNGFDLVLRESETELQIIQSILDAIQGRAIRNLTTSNTCLTLTG